MSKIHGLWLGPILALVGVLSYFFVFVQWPVTRDVPWLNGLILLAALALTFAGLSAAWQGGIAKKIGGVVSTFLSVALTGLFVFYIGSFSYQVPPADQAAATGTAIPDLVLTSDSGEPYAIQDAAKDKLILVFFRGYW